MPPTPLNLTKTYYQLPYRWGPIDEQTQSAIAGQLDAGAGDHSLDFLTPLLDAYPNRDFFGDLASAELLRSDADWFSPQNQPNRIDTSVEPLIVHRVYQRLLDQLLSSGVLSLVSSGIPASGALLYYSDRMARCVIFEYRLVRNRGVECVPLVELRKPDRLYDMDSALRATAPEERSALKKVLMLGHKIVGHRNTFVHVDRRRDLGVAGPFLDTILLNEMAHKYIYEHMHQDEVAALQLKSVLEIGCGSGLLAAAASQNLPSITRLEAIDMSPESVLCAYRNVEANLHESVQAPLEKFFVCGAYSGQRFSDFSIVLCNPPYIPYIPEEHGRRTADAISGTSLLEAVIASVPTLLSPGGVLLMVVSDLARRELLVAVREQGVESLEVTPPEGIEVAFDQEDILRNQSWLEWLVNERELRHRAEGDGFSHVLRCYAVWRSEAQGFSDDAGTIQRLKTMRAALGT
ncbi:MAG: hypothetical protein DHS20C21_00590 [Gemmatimonadota bacterium]|nr:MAG: hypothetical protein DHS20C21_00590 [Gemmatimonadota bacterium]